MKHSSIKQLYKAHHIVLWVREFHILPTCFRELPKPIQKKMKGFRELPKVTQINLKNF